MATEGPRYSVEKKDGRFELRKYDGYIVAQVEMESDFSGALNAGFEALAGYIFGSNRGRRTVPMTAPVSSEKIPMTAPVTSEKIPMTAPVMGEKEGAGRYRISFVMPGGYSLDTLPLPVDSRITFRKVGGHRAAAVTFSGWLNDERKAQQKAAELQAWLSSEGLKAASGYVVAQYNSPWTPGPLRRNEIIVEVE
jgi:hypothetical protein